MPKRLFFLILTLIVPSAVSAFDFYFQDLIIIPVRPIDGQTFEVYENNGAGPTQMWCAAGKFTKYYLDERGGDLAVLQARGPSASVPGRKSVIFTTRPQGETFGSYSPSIRRAGLTYSMTHANALCRQDYPQRFIRVRVVHP